MGIALDDIKIKDSPVSKRKCLYKQDHFLITQFIQSALLMHRWHGDFFKPQMVMFQVFFMVVNGRVDQYPPEPRGKGFVGIILGDMGENLHKSIIEHFYCFVAVVGIP